MSPSPDSSSDLLYKIDDIPPTGETLALGFQHYLTMFGSTVAIPLLLSGWLGITSAADKAALIATMFFISGLTTLLQVKWGNRLPIVQGGTFSFLAPTFAIIGMGVVKDQVSAEEVRIAAELAAGTIDKLTADNLTAGLWKIKMQHVQGAIIAGAVVEILIGVSGLVGKMLRFVGPITIAPTIAMIGLALFKFGAPSAGAHWPIGGLTILLIILFSQYLRKTHRAFELYPIVMGIVGAWGVAALCSYLGVFHGAYVNEAGEAIKAHPSFTDMSNLEKAPWFNIPMPFQWGMPQFGAAAIVGMFAGYLASMVESIGDYYACARLAGAPPPSEKVVNRGITFEGIGCAIAGVFGTGNGTTSYSENIGAIGLTRVGSRRVVMAGALLMLLLGLVAKFGALFTTIPGPIVGGMYCAMFGMIASVGLSNLQYVNLNSARNLFIIGFAIFMGISVPEYFTGKVGCGEMAGFYECTEVLRTRFEFFPDWLDNMLSTIGKTGMAIAALIALVLDNTIPGTDEERGLVAFAAKDKAE